ncbi:MAG: hypothetical protein U9Q78_05075 [Chloroflexota bacterium]|nr:hypothetical protein [Chloroflexota bacterium]
MIKLLMGWDIRPNREEECFDFVMKEFTPTIMQLGLQPTEAWYTMSGSGPQILVGGVTEDLDMMIEILESPEWEDLYRQLQNYVYHYRHRVVKATGQLQLLPSEDGGGE